MNPRPDEERHGQHPDTLTAFFESIASALGYSFLLMLWPRMYPWNRKEDPCKEDHR